MSLQRTLRRTRTHPLRLAAVAALLLVASVDALAQAGALYRCGSNDYTNALTEQEAISRHCTRIGTAEWLFSGSDAAGRQYTYNDRRTVHRPDGTVETWLQVADPADWRASSAVRTVSPHVIRCRQRTISSGATYVLDMRDNSVSKENSLRTDLFPPPERVAEALIRRLCVDRNALDRSLASR